MVTKFRSQVLRFLCLWMAMVPVVGMAHSTGENYIFLNFREASIDGVFEIHFDDFEEKLGIETKGRDAATVVEQSAGKIREYINGNFTIGAEGEAPYELEFTSHGVLDVPQGRFAQFHFRAETGPLPDILALSHTMCYEGDRLHRGLVCVSENAKTGKNHGEEYVAMVFGPTTPEQTLDLNNIPGLISARAMIPQGVLHIWIGIDHILFLIALMLPTVLLLKEGSWEPVTGFRKALWNILKVVTVFTIAHSVTLLLAALGYLDIPSRFVESVIALSIILVALNNITGKVKGGSLWVILFLGLFHGLGFASVMGHLPFRMEKMLKCVIGFNIGVELGQIAIVVVLFPLLFFLRKKSFYVPVVLKCGSGILILVAGYWFVQRAFDLG